MVKKQLLIKKISKDAVIPIYNFNSDVGLDLTAVENTSIDGGDQKEVKTGLIIQIPNDCVGLIRDRAGIVSKLGIHTAAGTFDPGYRGEVSILLSNFSGEEVEIEAGMKIAQLIIIPVVRVAVKEVKKLSATERGGKGFGSTGIKDKIKSFKELERISKRK